LRRINHSALTAGFSTTCNKRDFTYVEDLIEEIVRLAKCAPSVGRSIGEYDSLSPAGKFRIVNIAGGELIELIDFVHVVEEADGRKREGNSCRCSQAMYDLRRSLL
jgi:nucleoside-diphosphate-sugar epimerase